MSDLISCRCHPGMHFRTDLCRDVSREGLGSRLSRWLEGRLNPKQGRPSPLCARCHNAAIGWGGTCVYCGAPVSYTFTPAAPKE